jgi:hypothetical protein
MLMEFFSSGQVFRVELVAKLGNNLDQRSVEYPAVQRILVDVLTVIKRDRPAISSVLKLIWSLNSGSSGRTWKS